MSHNCSEPVCDTCLRNTIHCECPTLQDRLTLPLPQGDSSKEAAFEEARRILDEADFYAIALLLIDKQAAATAVLEAVKDARIGWVDHATMVSQVNAAVSAERAWWCKNFHRVMFFDSIDPPSSPWAYNQGTAGAARFVYYKDLDTLISSESQVTP